MTTRASRARGNATMARTGSPGCVDLLLMVLTSLSATSDPCGTVMVPAGMLVAWGRLADWVTAVCAVGPVEDCGWASGTGVCAAHCDVMRTKATSRKNIDHLPDSVGTCGVMDSERE